MDKDKQIQHTPELTVEKLKENTGLIKRGLEDLERQSELKMIVALASKYSTLRVEISDRTYIAAASHKDDGSQEDENSLSDLEIVQDELDKTGLPYDTYCRKYFDELNSIRYRRVDCLVIKSEQEVQEKARDLQELIEAFEKSDMPKDAKSRWINRVKNKNDYLKGEVVDLEQLYNNADNLIKKAKVLEIIGYIKRDRGRDN